MGPMTPEKVGPMTAVNAEFKRTISALLIGNGKLGKNGVV